MSSSRYNLRSRTPIRKADQPQTPSPERPSLVISSDHNPENSPPQSPVATPQSPVATTENAGFTFDLDDVYDDNEQEQTPRQESIHPTLLKEFLQKTLDFTLTACGKFWIAVPFIFLLVAIVIPTEISRILSDSPNGTIYQMQLSRGPISVSDIGAVEQLVDEGLEAVLNATKEMTQDTMGSMSKKMETMEAQLRESSRVQGELLLKLEESASISISEQQGELKEGISEERVQQLIKDATSGAVKENKILSEQQKTLTKEVAELRKLVKELLKKEEVDKGKIRDLTVELTELRHEVSEMRTELQSRVNSSIQVPIDETENFRAPDFADSAFGAKVVYSEEEIKGETAIFPSLYRSFLQLTEESDRLLTSPSFFSRSNTNFLEKIEKQFFGEDPSKVLSPSSECWAFTGSKGLLTVRFPRRIIPKSVALGHLSRQVAIDTKSAPKSFRLWALVNNPQTDSVHRYALGNYSYSEWKPSTDPFTTQSFALPEFDQPIDAISLEILSNYGNPNYTCLYRFSVYEEKFS